MEVERLRRGRLTSSSTLLFYTWYVSVPGSPLQNSIVGTKEYGDEGRGSHVRREYGRKQVECPSRVVPAVTTQHHICLREMVQ